jgi:hypothetical protein
MPEPTQHVQANTDAKADEPGLELGTVVTAAGRYAFVRRDGGGDHVYVGLPQLLRARIEYLPIGARVWVEARPASNNRRPWAARIRLAE